ncbi:S-layer homology domain-containing protein [Dysosmobacter sp.]|uniref:S-layer homology domain-containing protein n=1 Tax=Dysosmobacter sp. TaxID=2591382 RepID=UPI003AB7A5E1
MKKFLSLVLALVMTMSLVTVSAGAKDFTDSSKIQYPEAVDVMSAVKVIDGYAEGDFRPTATLTRGAAAKIICNLILGPTTASALVADAAPYSDVPTNHTFAGYIAYCQKTGIISGYADGTFKPANSLTGYAFMKMLLGALGYKAEQEGYTGANWSIQVAKRAMNIGLKDDLVGDFNGVKAVTREEACLYAFNTLKATMVEYEKNSTVTVGNITIKDTSTAKEMTNTGKTDGNIDKDGKMQFAEKYFTDLKMFSATDDFSRPATQWKIKAEEVGKYTDTPNLTYTKAVKAGDIYKDLALGSTIDKKDVTVYINGEKAEDASVALKKGSDSKIGKDYLEKSGKKYSTAKNGVLTEVFYDKDDDSAIITQVVTYVGQINKSVKATSSKDAYVVIDQLPMSGDNANVMAVPSDLTGKTVSGTLEFETNESYEDDAYVLYTYSQTADEVKSLAVAEKVEGYVSQTINKSNDKDENNGLTLAGTSYKMSAAYSGEELGEISVKEDHTAYLDQYGYAIYVEEVEEIGNYALLVNVADKGTFVGKKAELVFTDGTTKVVTAEKDYSKVSNLKLDLNGDGDYDKDDQKIWDDRTSPISGALKAPVIVTYKVDNDGVYTLKAVAVAKTSYVDADSKLVMTNDKASITVEADTNKESLNTSKVTANSATQFVVADRSKDGTFDDYTAYTGIKSAPSIDATSGKAGVYFYCKSGKMVTVMFVLPNDKCDVTDDGKDMIYLAQDSESDLYHDKDGNYFTYQAVVDGKITTVKVDEDHTPSFRTASIYKSYSVKDGIITKLGDAYPTYDEANNNTKQYVSGVGIDKTSKEYTVTLDTVDKKYVITVDDKAAIYYVDEDGNISESSYKSISQDDNDRVYAIVEDNLVKFLVIEEVPTEKDNASGTATVTAAVNGETATSPITATEGDTVVLTAVGEGNTKYDTVYAYQWFKDGKKLTGETGKTLTVSTTKAAAAAEYVCKITFFNDKVDGKDYVTTVSNEITVTVEEAPVADMNVLVNYVEANGTVVAQETTSAKAADAVNGYVTIKAKDPDGYTVKGLKSKMVEFKAGANVTVEFTVEAN